MAYQFDVGKFSKEINQYVDDHPDLGLARIKVSIKEYEAEGKEPVYTGVVTVALIRGTTDQVETLIPVSVFEDNYEPGHSCSNNFVIQLIASINVDIETQGFHDSNETPEQAYKRWKEVNCKAA